MDEETAISLFTAVVLEDSKEPTVPKRRWRQRRKTDFRVLWEWKPDRPAQPAQRSHEDEARDDQSSRG